MHIFKTPSALHISTWKRSLVCFSPSINRSGFDSHNPWRSALICEPATNFSRRFNTFPLQFLIRIRNTRTTRNLNTLQIYGSVEHTIYSQNILTWMCNEKKTIPAVHLIQLEEIYFFDNSLQIFFDNSLQARSR